MALSRLSDCIVSFEDRFRTFSFDSISGRHRRHHRRRENDVAVFIAFVNHSTLKQLFVSLMLSLLASAAEQHCAVD
jgi:hypothetical protein